MKIFPCYLLVSSILLFQTSLCDANSGNSINFSVAPDPITHCHQYRVDVAITKNGTLGVMPANCINRPDRPTNGSMEMNSEVTNTFNRILFPWRYSPHGAFKDSYFIEAMVGLENSEFKSAAGSSAKVSFIDATFALGYQWVWHNGLNVSAFIGLAHLIQRNLDINISPTESIAVSDYLDQQTSTNTHQSGGVFLGWAF